MSSALVRFQQGTRSKFQIYAQTGRKPHYAILEAIRESESMALVSDFHLLDLEDESSAISRLTQGAGCYMQREG